MSDILKEEIYSIFFSNLDVKAYLKENIDVASKLGDDILSGTDEHFRMGGMEEIFYGKRVISKNLKPYNEIDYLKDNPDVADSVGVDKGFISGFEHFLYSGYREILNGERQSNLIKHNEIIDKPYIIANIIRSDRFEHFYNELDINSYFEANPDILKAIQDGIIKELDTYLKDVGLNELYLGKRILRKELTPYNEDVYLGINRDLIDTVSLEFTSAFEHFLLYGYKEMLQGIREKSLELPLLSGMEKELNEKLFSINKMILSKSGLFNKEFYMTRYPDIANTTMDPLYHYLVFGASEGRDPNPNFNTIFYLHQYHDVVSSGLNPLVHYVLIGQRENRDTLRDYKNTQNEHIYPLPLVSKKVKDIPLNIAVVVHAFYIDVLEDIISSIDYISPKPDLFISVAQDADIIAIKSLLKDRGYEKVVIKAVENRGRDVAPFLIDFSKDLKLYDLCCKIHGKKSLYGGSEQTNWRNHLYHNLLGSKEIVDDILNAFFQNEKLGLLFSDNYGMIPYWGYTWLTNRGLVADVLKKLNLSKLNYILDKTYIDYPAGTMFWFRPEAISQILDADFKYEDFPEEPIGNDGTLAHGLERLFGYVTQLNGFDYVEQNHKLHQYIKNITHKNFNQHEAKTLDTAKQIVSSEKYIIFDIFDTLVTRTIFYPDNIFRIIENRVDEEFNCRSNFMKIRKETENSLRLAGHSGDVSYEDIYDSMHLYSNYTTEMIEYIRDLDFSYELKILRAKPEVVELLSYAYEKGLNVLFVSDMYLTKSQIIKILEKNSIPFEEENLLVSSDNGYRKDNATVWKYLIENKIIDVPKSIIIGDNEVSDAKIPGDFGIKSFHLLSERNNFFNSPFGKLFQEKFPIVSQQNMTLMGPVINKLFASPFNLKSTLLNFTPKLSPYEFGYSALAPFFYMFLSNLYLRFSNKDIYFLARDGYFIKELFEHYINSKKLNMEGKSLYLEISRRAVLGAVEKNKENLRNIILDLGPYDGNFSNMIYSRVGLSEEFLEECNIEDFYISTHKDLEKSYDILFENIDIINKHSLMERKAFNLYLESIEFFDEKENIIIDLGYSGTIQNYLYQLTNRYLVGEYLVTTDRVENIESEENIINGYFAHKINPSDISENIVYKYSLILEAYLTSNKGQLVCFEENDGDPIPRYKTKKDSIDIQIEITKGIKDYISDLSIVPVDFIDTKSNECKDISLFTFEYMLKNRHLNDTLLSMFHLEDDFTGIEKLDVMTILNQRGL